MLEAGVLVSFVQFLHLAGDATHTKTKLCFLPPQQNFLASTVSVLFSCREPSTFVDLGSDHDRPS